MENGSFPGLGLLKKPPQSILHLEAVLVSLVRINARGHVVVCWCPQSFHAAPGGHVEVCVLRCPWLIWAYGQGSFFCSIAITENSRLRMKDTEGFYDNTLLSPVETVYTGSH